MYNRLSCQQAKMPIRKCWFREGKILVGTKIRFYVEFDEQELIVDRLKRDAESLGLTVEQLIKRFVVDALTDDDDSSSIPGENLEDFLEKMV